MLPPLRNVQQRQQADCLVACAVMVLEYLGIQIDYDRLLRLLGTGEPGTPFSNIERLRKLNLFVRHNKYGNLALIEEHIELGLPVIVAVHTWALPHWKDVDTEHAVVVIGFDDENIYLNDPFFVEASLPVSIAYFLGAWSERDEQFAVVSLIEPD